MDAGIVAAIIAGGFSLAGIIISGVITSKKTASTVETAMKVNQAVTETKIDELTREVRVHNGFAERIPVLEYRVIELEGEVKHLWKYHEQ